MLWRLAIPADQLKSRRDCRTFGEYRIHAMVYQSPLNVDRLNERMRKVYQAEHWWAGWTVSEPAAVTTRPSDVADTGDED